MEHEQGHTSCDTRTWQPLALFPRLREERYTAIIHLYLLIRLQKPCVPSLLTRAVRWVVQFASFNLKPRNSTSITIVLTKVSVALIAEVTSASAITVGLPAGARNIDFMGSHGHVVSDNNHTMSLLFVQGRNLTIC